MHNDKGASLWKGLKVASPCGLKLTLSIPWRSWGRKLSARSNMQPPHTYVARCSHKESMVAQLIKELRSKRIAGCDAMGIT